MSLNTDWGLKTEYVIKLKQTEIKNRITKVH